MDAKKIGSTLSELRAKKGETLKDVADAIGVTVMALSHYENGKRVPRDDIKVRLAKHYGETVDSIFYA